MKLRKLNNYNYKYSNRGMGLEADINASNEYYLNNDKAVIYKKPTPITINKVNYHSRTDAIITEAHFNTPSTTDYNGVYKGKYIDFEAKETINEKGFPLNNIHKHQINHIRNIVKENGICFLIIRFIRTNETYLLMGNDFLNFVDNNKKSIIPNEYFKQIGYKIKEKFIPRIDYLEIINKMEEL